MTANEMQVGGEHYRSEYQHWDLVLATGMDYLAGNVTKYVARWRKKGGRDDLKKALHYLEKLHESELVVQANSLRPLGTYKISREVDKFCEANQLDAHESLVIMVLATWTGFSQLDVARAVIERMIEKSAAVAKPLAARPVPLTDSNKHADRVSQ